MSTTPSTRSEADPAAALYRGSSGEAYHGGKRALEPAAVPWVARFRAEKLQRWVHAGDTVLEFGAGAGWNLHALRCARRLACDVTDAVAPASLAAGIETCPGPESLHAGSVDVVLCHHVLEHLLEPAATLRTFGRILRPEGRLVLHVPWEREWRYARFDRGDANHHLFQWNAQSLGNLLGVLGWRIEHLAARRYGYDRRAANIAVRAHLGEAGFRVLRALMVRLRPCWEIEAVARPPAAC